MGRAQQDRSRRRLDVYAENVKCRRRRRTSTSCRQRRVVHAGAQKLGPDGCVYVMDWYDRYHCYQDANRDSPGLDRLKGRIYRVSYNDTPRAKPFDLAKMSKEELVELLGHANVWWRREAQRILAEKHADEIIPTRRWRGHLDENNAHRTRCG